MLFHASPRRARRAALAAAALAATVAGLAGAPAAFAGTAFVDGTTLRFDAAPAEVNSVRVTRTNQTEYTVEDRGARIVEGAGCSRTSDNAVRCTAQSPFTGIVAFLGDRTDSGRLGAATDIPARIDGGDGIDLLGGGGGGDLLIGGGGDDRFVGSALNDTYDGGPGADFYFPRSVEGDPGADLFNGGPGVDTASYASVDFDEETSFQTGPPVFLSLDDIANDGAAGEGDNLFDVEDAFGGGGDDVLTGNPESNTLLGGDGRDRIDGGPGIDSLSGGSEDDLVIGGDGSDDLTGGSGDDAVDGGTGDDNLLGGADQDGLGGGPGDDNLDGGSGSDGLSGGEGVDTVDYTLRRGSDEDDEERVVVGSRVAVTLDGVADDGFSGERDNAGTDVENVSTGPGADLITGNAAVNGILTGAGNDIVDTRDQVADSVICGAGFDTVRADGLDQVDVEGEDRCERVEVVGAQPGPGPGRGPNASRVRPRSLVVTVSPGRDRRAPYRFVTRGRLALPTGLSPATSCQGGRVSVQIKRGTKTVSTRRVDLRTNCTFSSSVRFARSRRTARGTLKVTVRFLGNAVLERITARPRTVRAG